MSTEEKTNAKILAYHNAGVPPHKIGSWVLMPTEEVRERLRGMGIDPGETAFGGQSMWDMAPGERRYRIAQRAAKGARAALRAMGAA